MYYKFLVEIPRIKGKVYERKTKSCTVIEYEFDRVYNPEKKYNTPKRKSIGKKSDIKPDMMYPNPNYYEFFPDAEMPEEDEDDDSKRSLCLRIGAFLVIEKIVKEYKLDDMLEKVMGEKKNLFLDLMTYSIICEDNANQYYPDYAFDHPLWTDNMRIYSDSTISNFLSESISIDDSIRFLNEWNRNRDPKEKIYISYDSTNKKCEAGDVEIAEIGHSKNGDYERVFNMAVAYDTHNSEPLFYEDYPGSIVDVSQLQYTLEAAKSYGYKNVGFILDRGYFSKNNIKYMDHENYDFIIMVKGHKDLVKDLILQKKGTFEDSRQFAMGRFHVNGTTVAHKLFLDDDRDRYFHIYYSAHKYSAEKLKLESELDKYERKFKKMIGKQYKLSQDALRYFDPIYYHEGQSDEVFMGATEKIDAIDDLLKYFGYFAIITSGKMSAREALYKYKSRDASEKLFRGDKSYLGARSERVYSQESVESKLFIEFAGMIVRNRIYSCLKNEVDENGLSYNYMNVPAALKELEKIQIVKRNSDQYKISHAVTKTQKTILKAFEMNTSNITKGAKRLAERLQNSKE